MNAIGIKTIDDQATDRLRADTRRRARALVSAFIVSQVLGACVEERVFDALDAGRRDLADLAHTLRLDEDALTRALRLMGAEGLVDLDGTHVGLTATGHLFTANEPQGLAQYVRQMSGIAKNAWCDFTATLRSGEPAFPRTYGASLFEWLGEHPEENRLFDEAQAATTPTRAQFLWTYPWPRGAHVVDVGCGSGELLAGLLSRRPDLTGTFQDLEGSIDRTRATIEAHGLQERARVFASSFIERVAPGDVFILSEILHDWNDTNAKRILEGCRRESPNARLMIVDRIIGNAAEPDDFRIDLHMLVMLGGRERSYDEWSQLLSSAGYGVTRVQRRDGFALIEAHPVT